MSTQEEAKKLMNNIEDTLNKYKGTIEEQVKTLIKDGLGESDTAVAALKSDLEKVNASLDSVKNQIKYLGVGVPGLREALDRKETAFSLQSLCKAMYRMARPSEEPGVSPWEGCDQEKEIIDAYQKELRTRSGNYAGDGSAGGILIPQEVSADIIGLVYASIPLLDKLPVTKVDGLYGEFIIPKLTGGPTAYMVGEQEQPTDSANTYGQITLNPRRAAGLTLQSKSLIYQSRGTSDRLIKQELVRSLQQKIHQMLLTGAGTEHQPYGLLSNKWSIGTSTLANLGTNGGRFTITDAALLAAELAEANEGDDNPSNYGYLMRPIVKTGLQTERVKQFSDQSAKKGQPVLQNVAILDDMALKAAIGDFATTTHLSATEAQGTSSTTSSVIYGNWSYFWFCAWQGMSLRVSDTAYIGGVSAFAQNSMWIIAEQAFNCAVTRSTAFKKATGAECSPGNW